MGLRKGLITAGGLMLAAGNAYAHCPLCTVGAAAAAGVAKALGVQTIVVGLFLGGFAISVGMMIDKKIKKKYVPFQSALIVGASFLTTVLPLMPLLGGDVLPFSTFWFGGYGTFFNSTHLIDQFLAGSVIGGALVTATPHISRHVTTARKGHIPYQGTAITLALLAVAAIMLQVAIGG